MGGETVKTDARMEKVIAAFMLSGDCVECVPYGSGHINDTYCVTMEENGGKCRYILQRMNKRVFRDPEGLMENIMGVTRWLEKKILEKGGDPYRETLHVVTSRDGKPYYRDPEGEYWRVYRFVEDTSSYDRVETPKDFYESAVSFGKFQGMLADYPAETLHETIRDFHNTPDWFARFLAAKEADVCKRAAGVEEEIRFVLEREAFTHVLCDKQDQGLLPLRVTHNDTKLNNILIDNATGKGICVIDLDTVMPGLSVNDFGDSIRFGASTADEDEQDLSKVSCDLHLFELYTKGFLEGCAGSLTVEELECLPLGAIMMTLECGIRFLTDYLEGDHYFKIQREGQNLDRCRTQFQLVKDMEQKLPRLQEIVRKYAEVESA